MCVWARANIEGTTTSTYRNDPANEAKVNCW